MITLLFDIVYIHVSGYVSPIDVHIPLFSSRARSDHMYYIARYMVYRELIVSTVSSSATLMNRT